MNWTYELIEDYKRCMNDIEYFAETHVKIVHPVLGLIPFKLNEFQKSAILDYREKRNFFKIASRQEGKTTIASVILLHQALFSEYKTSVIFGSKLYNSNYMLEQIAKMYANLPEHIRSTKITKLNKTELSFENGCSIRSIGNNVHNTRGMAISNVYIDESEFVNNLREIFEYLVPCISAANGKLFAFTSSFTGSSFRKILEV